MSENTFRISIDTAEMAKAYERLAALNKAAARAYPSIKTPALAAAMASVGPEYEWAWMDYLSAGDVMRVIRLREITLTKTTADDVHEAAMTALALLRRAAEERMMNAPGPAAS